MGLIQFYTIKTSVYGYLGILKIRYNSARIDDEANNILTKK